MLGIRDAKNLLRGALLVALLTLLYARIATKLILDWSTLPDDSYGFLVALFVGYLLWTRHTKLLSVETKPRWAGLALLVPGLMILLVGVLGADLFLSRVSFLLVVAGLILLFFGMGILRQLGFAFFVLFLAIPLPTLILNQVTFPLQLFASSCASAMLSLVNVPVLRDGNVIQLASMQLEVAEACSGIRSLMSLFAVAVIFGFFFETTTWKRVVLALASIPIAVLANAIRIFGTGLCVQFWSPEKAVGFFHEFSGWLIFLVSLLCLYIVHVCLNLVPRRAVKL